MMFWQGPLLTFILYGFANFRKDKYKIEYYKDDVNINKKTFQARTKTIYISNESIN